MSRNMESNDLMVTIRCITYNHEPYIRQCLEGFLMQKTNFRFEAIVHDDASTDGTAAIIREYAEKYPEVIKPIYETENQYSKRDGSLTRIMDTHTHGKYIAMCEGDDYWTDPLKLQKQVDFLEANPEYGLVHTLAKIYKEKEQAFDHEKYTIGADFMDFDELLLVDRIATLTTCFRSDLQKQYSKERHAYPQWRMGDYPLWLFIVSKSKAHFIPEITAVYRVLENSASHFNNLRVENEFMNDSFSVSRFFCIKNNRHYLLPEINKRNFYRLLGSYVSYDCRPDRDIWKTMAKLNLLTVKRCLLLMFAYLRIGRKTLRNRWQ